VAKPASEVQTSLLQLRNGFLVLLLLGFLLSLLMSRLLIRLLDRPIQALTLAARDIAERRYTQRIHFQFGHEFYDLAEAVNRMGEALDRQLAGLTEQIQRLEAVFNGMNEGVMVLNSQGRIQSVNRALSKLLRQGIQPLGRRPLEVIMSLDLQEACDRMLDCRNEEKAVSTLQIVLSDGRSYEVSMVRLQDRIREPGGILVFHELTEIKR